MGTEKSSQELRRHNCVTQCSTARISETIKATIDKSTSRILWPLGKQKTLIYVMFTNSVIAQGCAYHRSMVCSLYRVLAISVIGRCFYVLMVLLSTFSCVRGGG